MKMKMMMVCLAMLAGLGAIGQIAAWDFYGQSFPVTCAATTFHPNLVSSNGASAITRGPGAPASGGVNSFRSTGFQNNGISTSNTDYFQVTLQASPGYKLSLSTIDAKFNGTSTFFASPGVTSQFAYSLDGTTFTLIGSPVQSTALTMAQVNLAAIADLQNVYSTTTVTIRYYASGQTSTGGWGFYSANAGTNGLTIGGTVVSATILPPTVQASAISFSNVGQTQMALSWTPGNGEKRVVMINTANSFVPPANGTDPPANPVYGGSGQQVVYNYSGSSLPAVSGLVSGVTYWFRIFEYNGSGLLTQFNTDEAFSNPNSQMTSNIYLPPVVNAPMASSITAESAILGGHVAANGGSALTGRGTVWSVSSPVTLDDNPLAEGGTDTGSFTHLRQGLPPGTKLYHSVWAANAIGTSLAAEGSFFTLSNEPADHVTNFSAAASGTTSVDLTWTPVNSGADGYLILARQGTVASTAIPLDAAQYQPGDMIGDAVVSAIISDGGAGAQTISGLPPGTACTFTIFPFAWDGENPETSNYFTGPVIPEATASTNIPGVVTYYWIGVVSSDFTQPGNWNPARNIPALNDILIFDNGITATLVNVTTQSIGQLKVLSNTAITLQGNGTVTIHGDTGEDLWIAQGCQLNISGSVALSFSLGSASTGSVSGSMTLSGGGHRLLATAANGIVFQPGSSFRTGSGFSGNPFGTVNLNSVVFSSGSTYICQGGGNPFGATAPASVVVFQPGSLYRIDVYAVPSLAGRTYGNFEMNYPGMITVTGSAAVSIENFTASQGWFYFNLTGNPGHSIKGNIHVASVATLVFSPSPAGTVNLNGIAPQAITGTGALIAGQNSTFIISNPAGVTVSADAELNNVTISGGGMFSVAPDATVMLAGDLVN